MTVTLRWRDRKDARAWLRERREVFVEDFVSAGFPEQQAQATVDSGEERVDPSSGDATCHAVFAVLADGEEVGALWVGPDTTESDDAWWVWYVEIDPAFRGRGLGREAMALAEQFARERGATRLGLNVMGANAVARSLYESLGYRTVSISMTKTLGDD